LSHSGSWTDPVAIAALEDLEKHWNDFYSTEATIQEQEIDDALQSLYESVAEYTTTPNEEGMSIARMSDSQPSQTIEGALPHVSIGSVNVFEDLFNFDDPQT